MDETEADRQNDLRELEELFSPSLPPVEAEAKITIRLPTSLKESLKAEAELRGLNLSDYLRSKLSGESLPIRRPQQQVSRIERGVLIELNRIGINLNQALRKLNSQENSRLNSADRQVLSNLLTTLQKIKLAIAPESVGLEEEA